MAKDISLIIGGNAARVNAALKELERTGHEVASTLERDFQQLGIQSSISFDNKRKAAASAYEKIKSSGLATQEELGRAQKALADRMVSIDEEQYGKRASLLQKFKANWVGATAAMGAAWIAVLKAFDLAENAAMGLQKRQAFASLAASHHVSANQILEDLQRVSAGTISTQTLIEKAGTSMLLGIEAKTLPKLMEIARASSRITGDSITKSFEDISLAVGRQSKMILDNLGIIVNVEDANKKYAASLGKTASQLTDAERKQAFINATLAAGQQIIDRVGLSTTTQAEKLQRLKATMDNLKESVGRGVLGVMNVLTGVFQATAATALGLSGAIFKVVQGVAWLVRAKDTAEEYRIAATAAFEASKDLGQQAADSIASGFDLLSGKIDAATAANVAFGDSSNAVEESLQAQQQAVKDAVSALERYSRTISDFGREQLSAAESGFSKELALQEEYFKKTGAAASNMGAPLRSYLSLLDQVYGKQVDAQKDIASVLERIGADQAAMAGQQVNIATTEKTYFEARLKAWLGYYDKLKALHGAAMDEMKKKQDDLLAAQKLVADINKAFDEQFNAVPQQSQYLDTLDKLGQASSKFSGAMDLPPVERAKALEALLKSLSSFPREIIENGVTLISSQEMEYQLGSLKDKAAAAYLEIKQSQVSQAQAVADTFREQMAVAEDAMLPLEEKIQGLGDKIFALNQTITLSAMDEASGTIATIKNALAELKDKTITITANYVGGDAAALGTVSGLPTVDVTSSFAVGTRYVPKTGVYQLHRGEEVLTRGEVSGKGAGSMTLAPSFQISVNESKTPQATAKEIARQIFPELQTLMAKYRTA